MHDKNKVVDALRARDDTYRWELSRIGNAIGFGNSQTILGELWDAMLETYYGASAAKRGAMGVTIDDDLPPIPKAAKLRRQMRADGGYSMVPAYSVDELKAFGHLAIASAPALSDAARDVLAERRRQVDAECWTPQHDDEHDAGELAGAGAAYAAHASDALHPYSQGDAFRDGTIPPGWCWEPAAWKPSTARRNLVKAGALILAEIERIDRTGQDAPAPAVDDGEPASPEALQVCLILVGLEPSLETIATWSTEQQRLALEWASATHFRASDNDDVVVPPRPDFLPKPWHGHDSHTGDIFSGRQPTVF